MWRVCKIAFAALLAFSGIARAHIGSPDIYLDGKAGPYQLFVTIRPPVVIPGVAELEVRSSSEGVSAMHAVPLPMSGPGAKFAPVPDKLIASKEDAQLFTGSLWMMAPGSWQVRIVVDGSQGSGTLSIPVPSAALATKRMPFGLGAILLALGMFLVGGAVAMAGASVRESRLDPGVVPSSRQVRAGRAAMGVALLIVAGAVWIGDSWWNSKARSYGQEVYKPLRMGASLSTSEILTLKLDDPGWLNEKGWRSLFTRSVDDFIPDHGHLMHLYAIREPGLDVVYHLHPELTAPGVFRLSLPSMPAGNYRLYADVVHANGFPETLVSSLNLPSGITGRALAGDDAAGKSTAASMTTGTSSKFTLPDGYRMVWLLPPGGLHTREPELFRFRLERPDGTVPSNMAFYMGMMGHAAFVKTDGTVFAHVHPTGSVPMAAVMLAEKQNPASTSSEGMDMPGMAMPNANASLPNEVAFPYGFPAAGRYRIFVQMKHGETVETGVFDATVR